MLLGEWDIPFQSPRSGKFESNEGKAGLDLIVVNGGFNPLDRGNLNQIWFKIAIANSFGLDVSIP